MALRPTLPGVPECDRPYEKLELNGASSLTDSELLAVVLRAGTKKQNVIELARNLLISFGGKLKDVCRAGTGELMSVKGIGRIRALQLKAVGELAVRIAGEMNSVPSEGGSMEGIASFLINWLFNEDGEVFAVVMLDKRLRIIGARKVSKGTLDKTLVHPREVFLPAVRELAYAVVIAHNHPSGNTEPSREDVMLTARLIEAGDIMGIPVLDHIIVGKRNYTSFKARGLMDQLVSRRPGGTADAA